jgi:hypothetical protein
MQQILINEMSADEVRKSKDFLAANSRGGAIDGLYWLMIPEALLATAQAGHEACGPFAFAIEAGDDFVSFELLVRSESNLHCSCTSYATPHQRDFLLTFMDRLVSEQGLRS